MVIVNNGIRLSIQASFSGPQLTGLELSVTEHGMERQTRFRAGARRYPDHNIYT